MKIYRKVIIAPYCDTSFSSAEGQWKRTFKEASEDASLVEPTYSGFHRMEMIEVQER